MIFCKRSRKCSGVFSPHLFETNSMPKRITANIKKCGVVINNTSKFSPRFMSVSTSIGETIPSLASAFICSYNYQKQLSKHDYWMENPLPLDKGMDKWSQYTWLTPGFHHNEHRHTTTSFPIYKTLLRNF